MLASAQRTLRLRKINVMNRAKEANKAADKRPAAVRILAAAGIIVSAFLVLLMSLGWTGHIGGPIGITPVMLTLLQSAAPGVDPSVGHGTGLLGIPLAHHAAALSWLVVAALAAIAFKALARFLAAD